MSLFATIDFLSIFEIRTPGSALNHLIRKPSNRLISLACKIIFITIHF